MQIVAWGALKCVSFSSAMVTDMTNKVEGDQDENNRRKGYEGARDGNAASLTKILGFYSYMPSSYLGPLTTFEAYDNGVKSDGL